MSRILFVCTGNVARSQMAAVLYNQLTNTDDATSAGTEPILGRPIHEEVIEVLKDHGLATEGLFRKKITKEMFDDAAQVYSMAEKSVPAYMKDSPKVTFWDVPDPRDKGLEVHKEVFSTIEEKVQALTAKHD